MSVIHPDFESEQNYIASAYDLLKQGLVDAERSFEDFQPTHRATAHAMKKALAILKESRGSGQLVFGRIDDDSGDPLYIGRRRVYDRDRNLKVVGWHAPAAAAFYEATPRTPGDLLLKRVFVEQDEHLTSIIDEIVRESAASAVDETIDTPITDALLNELNRSRDGAMREVVSTIQSEQFAIIRSERDRPVVVQGGPGTGKSVVGLHRAAWLSFNHPELRRDGILVVAPSRAFLTYVAGVLPSLDVTDIDQVDVNSLYGGEGRLVGSESQAVARVKGSVEMSVLLANALRQRVGAEVSDLELRFGVDRVTISSERIAGLIETASRGRLPHNEARDVFRDSLATSALEIHTQEQRENRRQVRINEAAIRRLSAFTNAVDRLWPTFSPEELLRSLYGTQTWLVSASSGVLTADDRGRLYRAPALSIADEPWTAADMACLDELAHLLYGSQLKYGHLVVDEAQDLSPMVARVLARRCPSGSMTVLGDLAQATGSWIRDSWAELTEHLSDKAPDIRSLTIGYRVPDKVLALAAKQLAVVGADVPIPLSVRSGLGSPHISKTDEADLLESALGRASARVAEGFKTGLIVPTSMHRDAVQLAGFEAGDGGEGDFGKNMTILSAEECKGLEFDAVVLVEPTSIAAESSQGARLLYVAMTRCTQLLDVLHSEELPAGFEEFVVTDSLAGMDGANDQESAPPASIRGHQGLIEKIAALSPDDLLLVESIVNRLLSNTHEEVDDV